MISRKNSRGKVELVRPSFTYQAATNGGWANDDVAAQLAEDSRNTLEGIHGLLKGQFVESQRIRVLLAKIEKNTRRPRRRKPAANGSTSHQSPVTNHEASRG